MNTIHLIDKFPNDKDLGRAVRKATNALLLIQSYKIEGLEIDYDGMYLRYNYWDEITDSDILNKVNSAGFFMERFFDEDRGDLISYEYKF
jgi:hypothetical protein